jgi:two-component system, sensor histidine kinase and response regulator
MFYAGDCGIKMCGFLNTETIPINSDILKLCIMNLISIFNDFKILEGEKKPFKNELQKRNLTNLYLASMVVIALTFLHVIIFTFDINKFEGKEYQWRLALIFIHLTFFVVSGLIGFFARWTLKNGSNLDKLEPFITHFAYLFFLLAGVAVASIDQIITTAITPFFIICVGVPLVIIVPLIYSVFYYFLTFLAFSVAINLLQTDSSILLSIIINGLTSVSIGVLIAFLMWHNKLIRFRQKELIRKQKNKLEKQNQELARIAKGLKTANETKDKFYSIIAHDLRSPFTAIKGFSELVVENINAKDFDEVEKFAELILKSSNQAMDLLLNLMEWTRAQTGSLQFNPVILDLNQVVNESFLYYEGAIRKKGIKFENQILVSTFINADRDMISAVMRNLISNAVKFTAPGGRIEILASKTKTNLQVMISDTGIGIPPEKVDEIFHIEKRHSTKGTENEKGTGLGLMLCNDFIKKHDGKIWLESEVGKGSVFYFTIPDI